MFWKSVLCIKVLSKRLFQMGEPVNNKYKLFNVDGFREKINTIINFYLKSPGGRASAIIEGSVRDEKLRQEILEDKERELHQKNEK